MLDDFYNLPLSERWLYVLAIGLVVGLVLGVFMRRESLRRKPVHGGVFAHLFHYLAASTIAGFIPVIFIALISEMNFFRIVGSGLIFQTATLTLVMLHGFFESQAGYVEVKPARELD